MRTPSLKTPLGNDIHLVRNDDDATAIWKFINEKGVICWDTETEGLSFFDPIRICQIGNKEQAWVFDPHEHPTIMETILNHPESFDKIVAHNTPFDAIAIGRQLHRDNSSNLVDFVEKVVASCIDTQILAHNIDPRPKEEGGSGTSLKPLGDRYLGTGALDPQKELLEEFRKYGLNKSNGFRDIPLWNEKYTMYAGLDVCITGGIEEPLSEKIDELDLRKQVEADIEVSAICAGMTARGVRVDMDAAKATLAALTGEEVVARQNAEFYGVLNVNSTTQVADALMVRGVELTEKTRTGKWKVSKEVLDSLDDPLAKAVRTAKGAGKAMSSWVEPILTQGSILGRVHARINSLRARTGRMSVSDPALQQLPRDDFRIRGCLIADEGMTLIAADFDQIEVRVMAYLAGDKTILKALKEGTDIHSSVAENIYGANFTDEERSKAKQVVFAQLYGAGYVTLARQTGITHLEAKKLMAAFKMKYIETISWADKQIQQARFMGGSLQSPFGRRLPVDMGAEFRIVNHLIQSSAADVFKAGLTAVHEVYGEYLLLPIHDEILMQVPEDRAHEIGEHVCELMGMTLGEYPITASYKICGRSWGDAYKPKEALSV